MKIQRLVIGLTLSLLFIGSLSAEAQPSLSPADSRPERFDPYLKQHPENLARREAALMFYGRHDQDKAKLKQHTLAMIAYHPDNFEIYFMNLPEFYADPKYLLQVIAALEKQVAAGHREHGLYYNLAQAYEQAAIPPVGDDPAKRERFLQYYGLPLDTRLRTTVDGKGADKAIGYYKQAVKRAGKDRFHIGFYSEPLVRLLTYLDRMDAAIAVCKKTLPSLETMSRPDFLVTYGECLYKTKRTQEAKDILAQVRACDKEGNGYGNGHATMEAETQLGLIALDEGNTAEASKHLLASCDVQQCPHNITKGFPLELARRLLKAGARESVLTFCKKVLADFTPEQKETQDLLREAEQ